MNSSHLDGDADEALALGDVDGFPAGSGAISHAGQALRLHPHADSPQQVPECGGICRYLSLNITATVPQRLARGSASFSSADLRESQLLTELLQCGYVVK